MYYGTVRKNTNAMSETKYWRPDGLHDSGPGIRIVAVQEVYLDPAAGGKIPDLYNFAWYTGNCLKYIYATPAGRNLIDALRNGMVSITYHSDYNMVVTANDRASLNRVAEEVLGREPGTITREAAQRMNRFKFLGEFRRQPLWNLYANNFAAGLANSPITDAELWEWVDPMQMEQLKLATISTLDQYSPPGTGSGSGIGFCIDKDNPDNHQRPPAIGLAHELVHAYYSIKGAQCGRLGGDYTLPLFEFKCVGLGRPWLDSPITENAIRRQWGAIVASIPEEDKLNKQLVAPRLVYD